MRVPALLSIFAFTMIAELVSAQQSARSSVDFSGIYEAAPFVGVPDVSQPEAFPFSPTAARAFESYDASAVDPRARDDCAAETMPGILWSGNPMQISEEKGMIVMRFERGNTIRSIPFNDSPSGNRQPTELGYSVARWVGDVLTIETTQTSGGYLLNNRGYPLSAEGRLTERYWREPGENDLQLEVTVDDPVNYTDTFALGRVWVWAPHEEIRPWVCIDLGPADAEPDIDELTRLLEQL